MTRTTSFTTGCRSALSAGWTRREFLRGAAGVVALPHLPQAVGATGFAYVACGDDSLRVFRVESAGWTQIQRIPSCAPAFVLLSRTQQMLYVANDVDMHDGLPRGTVEVFRVNSGDGSLTLSSRIALSLSATGPRHLALSPDGRLLAVAAYGGGIYNLIAISADESTGAVSSIFKDAGCGPHASQDSAHPHTLVFDAGGRHVWSSDFGSDRLSVFSVADGRLERRLQHSTGVGSGPGNCVLHPSGSFVYAWHSLEGALVGYRHDGEVMQRVPLRAGALAVHPSGRLLYAAQGAWHIDGESGRLSRDRGWVTGGSQMVVSHDGTKVCILDGDRGTIEQMTTDSRTGEVHCKTNVAVVEKPRSIALTAI